MTKKHKPIKPNVAPRAAWACFILSLSGGFALASGAPEDANLKSPTRMVVAADYSKLPLSFEINQGQADESVRFLTHGPGYSLFLTEDGAVLKLQESEFRNTKPGTYSSNSRDDRRSGRTFALDMTLVGANPAAGISGADQLPGKSNYFIGNDPKMWRTNVPNYARVKYAGVYPGVDLIYYGNQGQLEYDFALLPQTDPRKIRLRIGGATRVHINHAGGLELDTGDGTVVLNQPIAYQGRGTHRRPVTVRYASNTHGEIGFRLGPYDRNQPLTIDPVLTYSTYLGGTGQDIAYGIAVDASGDAYVAGVTGSSNFPVKSGYQSTNAGQADAFVSKLSPSGSGLIYSTYIGGAGSDSANSIAIDSAGNAYLTGSTTSVDFPVTSGVLQSAAGGQTDAFVLKLNPSGSALVYASYLGGNANDMGYGIAVSASGNVYVTGSTESPNFPTANPLQIGNDNCTTVNNVETCSADVFVTEVNSAGTALVYSTYVGGSSTDSGQAIAVDAQGDAFIAGYTYSSDFPTANPLQPASGGGIDAFLTELNPSGSAFVFSTYLGGSGEDQAFGLALDPTGNVYVTGETQSADFPTSPGAFQALYGGGGDAFMSKLSKPSLQTGSTLLYSTFIGGTGPDQGNGIAVDSAGDAVVVGVTQSTDFPTVDPLQRILGISGAGNCTSSTGVAGVCSDAFITRLEASGKASYSTYLGGTEADFAQAVALDTSGTPYVAGSTASANFPVISGALQGTYAGSGTNGNAFVAKIADTDSPGVALTPQALNFGNEALNVTSAPQTVTLINAGSQPLQITDISPSGDFAVSNNCGTTVSAGGGICTISVTFTPTTAGATTDEITITDDAAGSPHRIAVTGTGVNGGGATLTLSPKALVFPVQALQTTSPAQTVQLINASQAAITITSIATSGDFAETNTCGVQPSVLNAGASCSATVTFTPTASGSRTGSLTITDNASTSTQAVTLTGTGGGVFTLSASNRSSNIVVGITSTTFTVTASAAPSFTASIDLSCSNATCSFNPASITAGQSSTVTVSGLTATTANPLNFSVTGTNGSNTSSVALSIFLQDFTVSATPPLDNVNAGSTATYQVTVTGLNGFNGVVLLNCSSTLPNETYCAWSPSSGLTLNTSSTVSATLTVTTTTQQTSRSGPWRRRSGPGPPGRGVWVLLVGLIGLLGATKAMKWGIPGVTIRRPLVLGLALIVLLAAGGVSCQNYGYNVIGTPVVVGTPTGVYVITISGTLGTNQSVVRSFNVNLNVSPG